MLRELLEGRLNRLFFDASHDCVKILDLQGRLLEMNLNGRCVMEVDDFSTVRNRQWQDLWPDVAQKQIDASIEAAQSGRSSRFGAFCPTAKGTPKWWDVSVTPIPDEHGKPSLILSVSREVTTLQEMRTQAQRRTEEAVEIRNQLDALLDAAPVGIAYANSTGELVLVNAANRQLWGEHPIPAEVQRYADWKAWWADGSSRHGQPLEAADWGLARALRGEEDVEDLIEIEPFDAPSTRKTVLLRAAPVRTQDGGFSGAVVAQMDITDRVRARSELDHSEAKFRTITEAMPQMVWSARADGFHDFYNQRWYEFTGARIGGTDGEGWSGMFHPEDRSGAWEQWRNSLKTGEPYEVEYRLRHKSGEYRWVLGRALPVRSPDGRVIRWMGTCTDIHQQKVAQEQLRKSEEMLREADRRKDEFLATLAHELRNPLAPLRNATSILASPSLDDRRLAWSRDVIQRQVGQMASLLDDLLDVARITQGKLNIKREHIALSALVEVAVEAVRPHLIRKEHELEVLLPPAEVVLELDRLRVGQALTNLLNNAAKYTDPRGHVIVSAEALGDGLRLAVRDNGIGLAPDALAHIFKMFTQLGAGAARSEGGLGIGLALSKGIVELHGGTISVSSAGPGHGCEFVIDLPGVVVSESPSRNLEEAGGGRVQVLRHKVLIADDNRDAAESLAMLLDMSGHQVRVVTGGAQALLAVAEFRPDIAFLDIGMPDIDGLEVARRLRAAPEGRDITLVALTGWGQAEDKRRTAASGFDVHLTKPADPVMLNALLAKPLSELRKTRAQVRELTDSD